MRKYLSLILILCLSTALYTQVAEQKIIPFDNGSGDFFGRYLKLNGSDLLIAAHQDDENGYASGSLYTFFLNENGLFEEIDKITPDDGDIEEFFGYSIDISGDFAITGSHHDSDFGGSSGSAFILEKSNGNWNIIHKIHPEDPHAGDEFAKSVGMNENEIACGTFLDDDIFTNSGSVYIFHKQNGQWAQVQEIYPADAEAYDQFGHFLSFNHDILLVGVPEKKINGVNSGCAYVFEKKETEYQQVTRLSHEGVMPDDHFGQAVAHSQSYLAVGAYKDDKQNINGGAVYLYSKTDSLWELSQIIVPEDNQEGDHFGSALAFHNDRLAIGAYFDDDNGSKSGSVYIYENSDNEYLFKKKIIASDGSAGDAFGAALDMNEKFLVVGAYADSENGFFSGSAYIYYLPILLSNIITFQDCDGVNIYLDQHGRYLNVNVPYAKNALFKIFDLQGRWLYSQKLSHGQKPVIPKNLNEGIYFIQLDLSCGQLTKRIYIGAP